MVIILYFERTAMKIMNFHGIFTEIVNFVTVTEEACEICLARTIFNYLYLSSINILYKKRGLINRLKKFFLMKMAKV